MFADTLDPYGGLLIFRAFVYNLVNCETLSHATFSSQLPIVQKLILGRSIIDSDWTADRANAAQDLVGIYNGQYRNVSTTNLSHPYYQRCLQGSRELINLLECGHSSQVRTHRLPSSRASSAYLCQPQYDQFCNGAGSCSRIPWTARPRYTLPPGRSLRER